MFAARPLLGLLIIALGTSPAALDTSLNIALPSLTRAFAIELHSVQWVVICYMLTYGSLLLVFGKLGDLFGHRRVFRVGLAATALGLLACALAAGYGWLLAGRALQGAGVAISLSCAAALATGLYPERLRARVLGAYGALFALSTALGPLVGGLLLEGWGWRAVFWYRLPLVLTALALSSLLPESQARASAPAFDAVTALLLAFSITALLLALASIEWDRAIAALAAAAAVAACALLISRERRSTDAMLPLASLSDVTIGALHLAQVGVNAASFAILLLVPYYLVEVAGLPAGQGGLLLSFAAVGAVVGSLAAGRLARPLGARRTALVGVLACAAGLAAVGCFSERTRPLVQGAALLLQGAGAGMFQVAYADLIFAAMPIKDRGVAGSLVVATRTIGIVGGAAGLSAAFQRAHLTALSKGLPSPEAFLTAFQWTLLWTWVGLGALLALTFVRPRIWLANP